MRPETTTHICKLKERLRKREGEAEGEGEGKGIGQKAEQLNSTGDLADWLAGAGKGGGYGRIWGGGSPRG